jgi:hypothetical protein
MMVVVVMMPYVIYFILLCALYLFKYLVTFLTWILFVQFMTSLYPNASFMSCLALYKNCFSAFMFTGELS